MNGNKGILVGTANLREVYLVQSQEPYLQNEYVFAVDPTQGKVPLEVLETWSSPMLFSESIPGCNPEYIDYLKESFNQGKTTVDISQAVYIAKAKVLKVLKRPLNPLSDIESANFEELRGYLIHADVYDSFKLGIVDGTEMMQKELPSELSNVSPLWKKKAVGQEGIPFMFNYHDFREYPHVGIFGTSGSGKTFGLRVLCEELMEKNIPGIALDPHNELSFNTKMDGIDQSRMSHYKDRHEFFYVGRDMGIPFEDLKFDELVYLFEFVGDLSEPMKGALESIYEKGDTYIYLKGKIDLLREACEFYDKQERDRKGESISSDADSLYAIHKSRIPSVATIQAIGWRLEALHSTNVFDSKVGISGIKQAILNGKLAILRGDMRRMQMVAFYTIRSLYKKRRKYQDSQNFGNEENHDYFPPFFVIVDEAHNFAPKLSPIPTKKILKEIAQEARKYGVYEIFCTQKPDGLDETIFAQLNTKIIYRVNTLADMELIKKETNLTEDQMSQLPELLSGHCFVSSATLPKTFSVLFRTTFTKSPHSLNPFEELQKHKKTVDTELEDVLLEMCSSTKGLKTTDIPSRLQIIADTLNRVVTIDVVRSTLNGMVSKQAISEKKTPMGSVYKNM